tara:strand:+ start:36 stop:884 length:849 start_codon:yes stop_codon:yes gene_type:complete
MPIFDMYGGRPNLYTEDEKDRIKNPEKYNYDQARYDAFIASLNAKVASRQAVDERGREVVSTSYANFGAGGTNPGFSLAGRSGHTSGGLAGNAGTAQYADGGMVQHMQRGGMASPYADPMQKLPQQGMMMSVSGGPGSLIGQGSNSVTRSMVLPEGPQQGIGGLFQNMHQNQNQMGMMKAQMGGAPLEVYGDYLNNVYTAPQVESVQAQVTEFIDMVDQAERAHFGAEESFGYGGGSYQQGLMDKYQQSIPSPYGQFGGQNTAHVLGDDSGKFQNSMMTLYS